MLKKLDHCYSRFLYSGSSAPLRPLLTISYTSVTARQCISVLVFLRFLIERAPVFDPKLHPPIPEKHLPHCMEPTKKGIVCGGLLRPHIVWFGENLDPYVLRRVRIAMTSADVCLVVGTSAVVYPAAGFAPELAARGVPVAEVNIEETSNTDALG